MSGSLGATKKRGGLGASDYQSSSGGGGAPIDAQYWVGAANGTLTAEHNLGALATGLVKNTAGVPSIAVAGTDYITPANLAAAVADNKVAVGNGSSIIGPTNFHYDRANDRLGLSVTSPAERLQVNGCGLFTGSRNGTVGVGTFIYYTAGQGYVSAGGSGATRLPMNVDGDTVSVRAGATSASTVVIMRGGRSGGNNTSFSFDAPVLAASSGGEAIVFDINLKNASPTVQFTSGPIATVRGVRISEPQYSATTAVTLTNAATLAIQAAPIAQTNITITNSWALWIQAGDVLIDSGKARFDGNGTHVFELPADATGNVTAATGRIPILVGGTTKYLRYFDD